MKNKNVIFQNSFNQETAQRLKAMLCAEISKVKAEIYKCRELCGYYAEKGGLLAGFEKC